MEIISNHTKGLFLGITLLFIALEAGWAFRKKRKVYNWRETLSNFSILLVNQLLKPLRIAWTFAVFAWAGSWKLFEVPETWWAAVLAVLVVDFFFYWQHRVSHQIKLLWTLHHVHHSSLWMNLTTSFRLNWMGGLIGPFFFLPALWLGFAPEQAIIFFAINLFFQFFLHTEAIGKLGWLEGWVNTPSAHRVHHGSNRAYIDKNFGGLFMVWDRLFGTYAREEEPVRYGVTTGFAGHNPVKAVFGPLINYCLGRFKRERQMAEEQGGTRPSPPAQRKAVPISRRINPLIAIAEGLAE